MQLLKREAELDRKILIVDDEFIEREMLGAMLSDLYQVIYAENGVVALDIIKRDRHTLSLIVTDLHMPQMDGYELLKVIRSDSEMRRIPVIVLTSEKGSEVECLQMGASDFITKPYEAPEVVRARVSHSIELAEDSVIINETQWDELTGLFNRQFFFEYGKRLDKHNNYKPMDAVTIDINRFRMVNELYGRAYGDLILKKISAGIHGIIETTGGLACRSDSNCFYLYIPHDEDLKEKINEYISRLNEIIGDNKISIRIGVCLDDGSEPDMERMFDRANAACAKLRNTYSTDFDFYNSELHSKELYSQRLINDMDKALSEKQFKVFYQPKYSITGDKPVLSSAEALIRWFHPQYGMISPGMFISLFEDNGLIHKLDRYVWNEAAQQIKIWKEKFGLTLPVSVNVSRVDIFDPKLGEELSSITRQNGLEPDKLLLEITESAYTDNSKQIADTVSSLRSRGFRIEMDDFGSGYSSLNMLTTLPIDALKLDMAFIRNICTDLKASRLVEIMIQIAKLLEVPVIAEGVETKEQMELLKELGCHIIQGYYFSKPVPPDEFDGLIQKDIKEREKCLQPTN